MRREGLTAINGRYSADCVFVLLEDKQLIRENQKNACHLRHINNFNVFCIRNGIYIHVPDLLAKSKTCLRSHRNGAC